MNTNLLLVTNIPRSVKNVELLRRLENKWARILFVDNAFADLYDAFIYNPTQLISHFEMGVSRLREFAFEGIKPLKVYHVWFPPPNVYLTTMIPVNASMLPFLFVDNLPKEIDSYEVIGELPFQPNEVKHWDIPQKEDKWMILRLPINQDENIRDYVLKYIRSRRLSTGLFPRVLEVFVSEEMRLYTEMIPRTIKTLPITFSYKANLLFIYDISPKLTVKTILEACQSLNVRGVKAFFIDVVNSLRVGFLVIPKTLPENRLEIFFSGLKEKEIHIEYSTTMLNIDEVYLQPEKASPPRLDKKLNDMSNQEFVLTNYLYIHNVAACVDHSELTVRSPVHFKVYLYQVTENTTQIGFVCLRGFSDSKIHQLISHLRSLKFETYQVMVDNIYLKCQNLPEDHSERRSVHIPRTTSTLNDSSMEYGIDKTGVTLTEGEDFGTNETMETGDGGSDDVELVSCVEMAGDPPEELGLMKSDFIFIDKLNENVAYDSFDYLKIDMDNLNIMSFEQRKVAFFYYPDTNQETWLKMLEKIAMHKFGGSEVDVSEVYLQSVESVELLQTHVDGISPSRYVFVYNITDINDTRKFEENPNILRFSMMTPESGSCAFVELVDNLAVEEVIIALNYIREITQRGTNLCADLVWFAKIRLRNTDITAMRSKWIKKSSGGAAAKKPKFAL